jgi:hypothetical protein
MKDGFEATFVVELAPEDVWQQLARRQVEKQDDGSAVDQYILPGFPSSAPETMPGARCSVLEVEPGRLLRARKAVDPCSGTEIAVTLQAADTGTRVTIVQSGFGPWLEKVRDTFGTHWNQIVADFRLYLERGLTVPGTRWGTSLGAYTRQTPTGLEIFHVPAGGFGERAGMRAGDLLLTLRDIRVHDTQQLWTILALTPAGSSGEASWARGREVMKAEATF